jgi:8-oxo-dGTP pyrophosphatase MutT (NUDIX family)
MYKVFVNDRPLFLTNNTKLEVVLPIYRFEKEKLLNVVKNLLNHKGIGCYFFTPDLETDWERFQSLFEIQTAGGGKVINQKGEVLFIFRNDKWDLPKGKAEKGESIKSCAIREVVEECGIPEPIVHKELETTFHIFEREGKLIFKVTHWYEMSTDYTGQLQPQTEEGITLVAFKDHEHIQLALNNSYNSIRLLFQEQILI